MTKIDDSYKPTEYKSKFLAVQTRPTTKGYELFEVDVYSLMRVIAELQMRLVGHGENYKEIIRIFEMSGVSKVVFDEFDLRKINK